MINFVKRLVKAARRRRFCFAGVHFDNHTYFPDPDAEITTRQNYVRGLVLGKARKIHSYIESTLPPKFYRGGVKKCEMWPRLLTPVAVEELRGPIFKKS